MLGYVAVEIAARMGCVGGSSGGGRGTSTGGFGMPSSCSLDRGMEELGQGIEADPPTQHVVDKFDAVVESEEKSLSSEAEPVASDSEDSYSVADSEGDGGMGIAPVQASRLRI